MLFWWCVWKRDTHWRRCVNHEWCTDFLRFFFYLKSWQFIYKYIIEWYGTGLRLIKKWVTRDQVTKILITHQEKQKRQVLCKFFTKILFLKLYVSLTNMYCLLCIMQSHKMTKLNKIISDIGPKERKILMETLQKNESSEWKNTIDPIWVSFLSFH